MHAYLLTSKLNPKYLDQKNEKLILNKLNEEMKFTNNIVNN